jgi:hypothetical protein
MPITIKELLPSDLMAQVVEKINFNFDQLLLAGGGPPGPQGPIGPAGVPGPIGPRGDHWFVGASAFNQQFDHDGISPLKVEDHFLDPLGDVYSYFDIAGVTGWTYSGINLMGPTGPPGAPGGSNELSLYEASLPANAVSNPSYGPSETQTPGTSNIDFLIPNSANKNSIFLGGPSWALNYLQNFGIAPVISPAANDPNNVPKLAIIQNNTNLHGTNGLVIGAMGLTEIAPGSIYGGDTSLTNAENFFYAGFANELVPTNKSKFLMRTMTMPMKIQVGGLRFGGVGEKQFASNEFELFAGDILLDAYDGPDISRNFIRARKVPVVGNIGVYNGNAREVIINSLSNISSTNNLSGNNIWGYVGLQNLTAEGNTSSILGLQHGYGTVIIGPTYSSSLDRVYGLPGRQGLAIVRKITAISGTNNILEWTPGQTVKDSAISFYQMDYAESNDTDTNSAIGGRIVPVRTFNDPAFWSGEVTTGNAPNVIDSLIIGAGLRTPASLNTNATAGGRISIQNRITDLSKPQMTFHVSLDTDQASRNIPWDGGPATPGIQHWAVGFDQWAGETRPGGIGIAYTPWTDGFTTLGNFRRNPIIQTYYRRDRGTTQPNDNFTGNNVGRSQGRTNPHMYLQLGSQRDFGNIGIGFFPGDASYSGSNTEWTGNAAFAKVSIQGSVVIGSTSTGFHKFNTFRLDNSILLEGSLIQGPTGQFNQINTAVHGYTATNTVLSGAIAISTRDLILGRSFISRGYNVSVFIPDFALPDLKTGMSQGVGNTGIGYLVANNIAPVSGPTPYPNPQNAPFNTTPPARVAKFAARGEAGYSTNVGYASLTAEQTFSTRPRNLTIQDLTPRLTTAAIGTQPNLLLATVWEIPTNSSLIFLNLESYRTNMTFWEGSITVASPGQWVGRIAGQGGFFPFTLDGTQWQNPTTPTFASNNPYSIGYTLEDGHFDGQTLKLIILGAFDQNIGAILPGKPISNGSLPQGFANMEVSDTVIMSPEPLLTNNTASNNMQSGIGSPTYTGLSPLTRTGTNEAYPVPFGIESIPSPIPQPLGLPASYDKSIMDSTFNQLVLSLNLDFNQLWTNNALSGLFSGTGFGTFYTLPYRAIEFVWRFDSNNGTSGKWFEIGRENLVRPQTRNWSLNGRNSPTPVLGDIGGGDDSGGDIGGGDLDTNLCCFVPGTLISMADGTFKPIEDIEIGDKFLSIDIETRETVENEVKETATSNRFKLFNYTLDNGTTFTTTEDHPIWVVGKGWSSMDPIKSSKAYHGNIEVSKIEVGDILIGDNSEHQIVSIVRSNIIDPITTYTFTAKDIRYQNYIAAGILVHNKTEPIFQQTVCLAPADPLNNP